MITGEERKEFAEATWNLCDTCGHAYPECRAYDVLFGNGVGKDNITYCKTYTKTEGSKL